MGARDERRLISAVLRTGDMRPALEHGITAEAMPNYSIEWQWLTDRLNKVRKMPSTEDFRSQFPTFQVVRAQDVDLHAGAVAEEHAKALVFSMLSEGIDSLQGGMPATKLLEQLNKGHRTVAKALGSGGSVDGRLSDHRSYLAEVKRRQKLAETGGLGTPYGLQTLDDATGGMTKGHLIIWCSRPSVGKSWMLLRAAVMAVLAGKTVLFFSLEMNKFSVQTRLISLLSGMDPKGSPFDPAAIRKGSIGRSGVLDLSAFLKRTFAGNPLGKPLGEVHIVDSTKERITPYHVQAAIERTQPDVVMLDYLQLFARQNAGSGSDLRLEVARHSSEFKGLAEMYEVPWCTASQLNRSGENKHVPPGLSTLAESDSPGQDADLVITMVPPSKQVRKALVAKNREGPDNDLFYVHFDPSQGLIEEVTPEEAEQITANEVL